ncbi:hypothetical protein KY290_013786 [Solanum tuberosum]|uniref:Uncharacterized protein n=1 Tax=Solanum tuberosum TaxID=4113 RepID=A0ABQ7VND2_SOLTU|nr:hypothetical protein KY289_013903 [Solanum tuberosum]KAH0769805.1 hypothetical protein KY290_013786 [Solanum tuberosum]
MSTATALVISPFLRFPKFSNSKLDFRRKFASFSLYTKHKSSPLTIARTRTTAEDEAMGVSFEKEEVFVDASSSSASAGLNATLNSLVRSTSLYMNDKTLRCGPVVRVWNFHDGGLKFKIPCQ